LIILYSAKIPYAISNLCSRALHVRPFGVSSLDLKTAHLNLSAFQVLSLSYDVRILCSAISSKNTRNLHQSLDVRSNFAQFKSTGHITVSTHFAFQPTFLKQINARLWNRLPVCPYPESSYDSKREGQVMSLNRMVATASWIRLVGWGAVWVNYKPTFRRYMSYPSSR
jgi:hypothetical protein